jgi:hypothetical protein
MEKAIGCLIRSVRRKCNVHSIGAFDLNHSIFRIDFAGLFVNFSMVHARGNGPRKEKVARLD